MKIIIDHTGAEQREAKVIEAFIRGLVSDVDVQRIDRQPAKEEST